MVAILAGLGSWPDRGVVASQVLAMSGPRRSPSGGSMGGGELGGCQTSALQNQFLLMIHPCASSLLQLVQPDAMEGYGMLPTIELRFQHQFLEM